MNKKQIVMLVIFIVLVSVFRNCDFELPFMKNPHFNDIAIGKTFSHSRDGHCLKVADNYCLAVDLGSVTTLGKIPDEYLNEEWTYNYVYRNAILEAHYIKAYFNDTHLVLCEEDFDFNLNYLSFEFSSEKVIFYESEEAVLNTFEFESTQWRVLCNTYEQILRIHDSLDHLKK